MLPPSPQSSRMRPMLWGTSVQEVQPSPFIDELTYSLDGVFLHWYSFLWSLTRLTVISLPIRRQRMRFCS